MTTPVKREREIKLRLSNDEHELISKMANGKPVASFIREYCLSADNEYFAKVAKANRAKINRLTVNPELLRQLAGVGNNVNQISRNLNGLLRAGNSVDLIKLAIILKDIERHLKEIKNNHEEGGE